MPVVSKTTVRLYPPDIEIIDAWADANPDTDTGETPSRPTAIRRMIRLLGDALGASHAECDDQPATRRDLAEATSRIIGRL